MDRDLAKHVIAAGFRSASALQDLLPLLKAHCGPAEYDQYPKAISSVSFEITTGIFNQFFCNFLILKTRWIKKSQRMENLSKMKAYPLFGLYHAGNPLIARQGAGYRIRAEDECTSEAIKPGRYSTLFKTASAQ